MEDYLVYGPGWTILDADGDSDLDLLGGRTPEEDAGGACLYLNESTPGTIRFVADDRICGQGFAATSTSAFDVDGDGRDEMYLMFFQNIVELQLEGDGILQRQLFEQTDLPENREYCDASTLVPIDIDFDGDLDGLVGCTSPNNRTIEQVGERFLAWTGTHLLRNDSGVLRMETGQWPEEPGLLGNPLTFGVVDLDENGLPDLVAANDSFSTIGRRNLLLPPGTLHVRCLPTEDCTWKDEPLVDGEEAHGSFMGVAVIRRLGARLLLLSDWGPKRALDLGEPGWPDVAQEVGLRLPDNAGFSLYSWGVLVDDFDLDGLDDVLFTHGMIADGDVPGHGAHVPFLAMQGANGAFSVYREGLGFTLPAERARAQSEVPPSQRSVIRADFDQDGRLDLFVVQALGYPELYTDTADRPGRCTVFPQTSFAPAWGHSFAFRLHTDDVWHEWFVWGGMRVGASNGLLLPSRQGELRWPSGAVTPWDCGIRTTLTLAEPDWVELSRSADTLEVSLDTQWWPHGSASQLQVVWRDGADSGQVDALRQSDGLWTANGIPAGSQVLLVLDGRYIPRWWQP